MRLILKVTFLVAFTGYLVNTIHAHLCIMKKRREHDTNKLRWSLPVAERCLCQAVVAPERKGPNKCSNYDHGFVDLWFTDDPEPLTLTRNWTPEKLDTLLQRNGYCDRDECNSNPCQYGGTCQDKIGEFICECSSGFSGQVCEIDVEAPTFIVSPANQTLKASPGESTALVEWTIPEANDNSGHITVTCNAESGTVYNIGQTEIVCEARDASGNEATCTFIVDVTDDQAPTFSFCPADQSKMANSGESTAVVEWTSPVATDNSRHNVTVTCNAESGAVYEIGQTEIVCEARDASGNEATCTFIVDVTGCQAPLGMESNKIPDASITASSFLPGTSFDRLPKYARLGNPLYWAKDEGDTTPWIQVDLGALHIVTGILTQGTTSTYAEWQIWVSALKVATGTAIDTLVYINDNNGQPKTFAANTAAKNTIATITFPNAVTARFVKIYPTEIVKSGSIDENNCVLRLEILGC